MGDSLELIEQYGAIFNRQMEASVLIEKIKKEFNNFEVFIQNKPTLKVLYFIWKNPWMVAANKTFINYLLRLNKFENVFSNEERYPEIELSKSSINKSVEVVLLSSEPFPFNETHAEELQEFYPDATIKLVDGEMFSWYGSRLTKAFTYFKTLRLNLQNIEL